MEPSTKTNTKLRDIMGPQGRQPELIPFLHPSQMSTAWQHSSNGCLPYLVCFSSYILHTDSLRYFFLLSLFMELSINKLFIETLLLTPFFASITVEQSVVALLNGLSPYQVCFSFQVLHCYSLARFLYYFSKYFSKKCS